MIPWLGPIIPRPFDTAAPRPLSADVSNKLRLLEPEVGSAQGEENSRYLPALARGHGRLRAPPYAIARTSTNRPAMAAAAAIAGDTRWLRPLGPCRPSKFRFEVVAQRS